jgi:glyoxylase-like metal-dependent hydrolase (beta-lactamase superfamily II)
MKYAIIPVTPFEQNCTLFWCEDSAEAAIIDPGGDIEQILAVIEENALKAVKILLTHTHIDHAGATGELAERLNIDIEGPHPDDQPWIDALDQQSQMFGFPKVRSFTPNRWLKQGDKVHFGQQELEVMHCPGHTPGHVVFFHRKDKLAQVGDVLFKGSIGRTDFPMGNHKDLIRSIRERLFPLGDDVRFIPGHGPMSTFGEERRSNPFVGDAQQAL